ncbi:MAG: glycerophosphodiester phosphodiesterase family protein [Nevskiales bacterium]
MLKAIRIIFPLAFLAACGGSDDNDDATGVGNSAVAATLHSRAAPEGGAGESSTLPFLLSINQPQDRDLHFEYATQDMSAVAGEDYEAATGTAMIGAGQTETLIPVTLIGDGELEPGEQFVMTLTSKDGFALTNNQATGVVANDDTDCSLPDLMADNPWRAEDRQMLNFAHRGGVIDFPENTLYAYKQAALAGADVLEMDVYQTIDGELVILHDLTVDRTTNGTGDVGSFTLAELRELDAAYWFVTGEGTPHDAPEAAYTFRGIATGDKAPPAGYTAEDFRIPTLEEALQAFPNNLINVELKPDTDGTGNYEAQMAGLLVSYGRITDVMVASFVDTAANNFKLAAPCVSTSVPLGQAAAVILASQGPLPMAPLPVHHAFQVPPDTSQISQIPEPLLVEVVNQDMVNDAHAANLAVHVWTINDCPTMIEMLELGVDGVMTDRPLLLEKVLGQPEDSRSCEGLE